MYYIIGMKDKLFFTELLNLTYLFDSVSKNDLHILGGRCFSKAKDGGSQRAQDY